MPFKSTQQRKFLYAKKPAVAQDFADKTPKGAKLPKVAPKPPVPLKDSMARRLQK